jgi:hypothetical protein
MTRLLSDARDKLAHCEKLLAAYDLVLDDLSDWDSDEWVFVRKRVEMMRLDIADEIEVITRNSVEMVMR